MNTRSIYICRVVYRVEKSKVLMEELREISERGG
jgi:hypothetical protein